MTNSVTKPRIAIIGAGPAGSLMAIYLARRGFNVEVYERRGDMRHESVEDGRSINLTLAARGLHALDEVGLLDTILSTTVPLKGRIVHAVDGTQTFQPYGKDGREVIYSIKRNDLNIALLNTVQSFSNVKLVFNKRCVGLNKGNGMIHLQDEQSAESLCVSADLIIGADGAFSTVRQQMQRAERANYQQEFLEWGYKQLTIPPGPNASFLLRKDALHVWPRGDCMMLAIPNFDGCFTCTCILPYMEKPSLASLQTESDVLSFFNAQFSDAAPLMPRLVDDFLRNPTGEFISMCTDRWYYKDRIVLLGDACHAVYPFYGQGMNAAFEDCSVLNNCIGRHGDDWEAAFADYQRIRQPNTTILAELSKQNFVELRDTVRSPMLAARKKVYITLNQLFPRTWIPLYTMITHTTIPYADALARCKKQDRIAKLLGIDLIVMVIAALLVFKEFWGSVQKLWAQ